MKFHPKTNNLHAAQTSLQRYQVLNQLRNFQHCIEHLCSELCVKECATAPCPQHKKKNIYIYIYNFILHTI